jgi:sulfatase modifying factor 1
MTGNCWESCSDWYRFDAYQSIKDLQINPQGPDPFFDPDEPNVQ